MERKLKIGPFQSCNRETNSLFQCFRCYNFFSLMQLDQLQLVLTKAFALATPDLETRETNRETPTYFSVLWRSFMLD